MQRNVQEGTWVTLQPGRARVLPMYPLAQSDCPSASRARERRQVEADSLKVRDIRFGRAVRGANANSDADEECAAAVADAPGAVPRGAAPPESWDERH